MEKNYRYIIPGAVLKEFEKVSLENMNESGKHKETIAILIGTLDDKKDLLLATEIIFPEQTGSSDEVEDLGT